MLFTEAQDHPVMTLDSANRVGRVHELVVDPHARAVVALRLKKTPGNHDMLHWDDVTAVGPDAVTVPGEQVLSEPREAVAALVGKDHRLLHKRVLTSAGDEVGVVRDVDFDAESGAVLRLLTDDGELDGDRLLGCGSYAVVVRAEG